MGLLEGIVVAAFAIGLAMGILLRKCVCRPCGFCGGDDRKVFKASKILKPAPVQKKKRDDHYFGPVYLTTSVGRYFMKPDCQMHKMQKCEICKDCLRDFKKKFHSRVNCLQIGRPKKTRVRPQGCFVSYKMVLPFFTVFWTLC